MSKITNQNVNTIIFPPDMELRKVKKPKRKKTGASSKKKQAIADLRQALQDFDAIINEAKNKKVSIPANLGSLPQDIKDVDSVKEIVELTNDIRQRIQQIRALIEQASKPQADMFRAFIPTQGQAPRFAPTPTPVVPQPTPIQPQPTPIPKPTPEEDKTAQSLDELRKEILDKLSPEERQKAEEKLKEEGFDVPDEPEVPDEPAPDKPSPEPVGPVIPEPEPVIPDEPKPDKPEPEPVEPIIKPMELPEGFELNRDVIGGQEVNVIAPKGFYKFVLRSRKYEKDVGASATQIGKGEFKLTADKYANLEAERQSIKQDYIVWKGMLSEYQIRIFQESAAAAASPREDKIQTGIDNALILEKQIDKVTKKTPTQVLIDIVGTKGEVFGPDEETTTQEKLEEEAKGKESKALEKFRTQLKIITTKVEAEVEANTEKKNAYGRKDASGKKQLSRKDAKNGILNSENVINKLYNSLVMQFDELTDEDRKIAQVGYNGVLSDINNALKSADSDLRFVTAGSTKPKSKLSTKEKKLVDFAKGKGEYTKDILETYGKVFSNHRAMLLGQLHEAKGIMEVREQVKNDLIIIDNVSKSIFGSVKAKKKK